MDNGLITSLPAALKKQNTGIPVYLYTELTSTNDAARDGILSGKPLPFAVIANRQLAGRGRKGHSFFSPAGAGLYLTLAAALPEKEEIPLVTILAAVAARRAILKTAGLETEIKWVNDLYRDGKKVCGILAERVGEAMLIGIGINVHPVEFPPELREIAGSLNAEIPRSELAAALLLELKTLISALHDHSFLSEYRAHSLVLNREVSFQRNGALMRAVGAAIDAQGGLVVRYESGETETLTSGEISVRLLNPGGEKTV